MKRLRSAMAAGGIGLAAVATAVVLLSGPARAQPPEVATYLANINALRASVGAPPLQLEPELMGLSQAWAEHMAATKTLAHPPDITVGFSTPYTLVGDNMALGSTTALTWEALVNSPVHYRNLVDPVFTHVGIGVAYADDGVQYTHEWFLAAAPFAPPEPEPEAPVVEEIVPPPVSEEPIAGVLGEVERPAVNLAVIPAVDYGRPPIAELVAPAPSGGSSPWPFVALAIAIIALLVGLATMALRGRRRGAV
jgi:hypothetical protein